MRVLICPDRMASLSSSAAGRALAVGWPDAVTRAVGEAGRGFVEATADQWGVPVETSVLDGVVLETAWADGSAVIGVSGAGPVPADAPIPVDASVN
ncbi:MAG TPA: hypothetical protein VFU98_19650, partial [Microlunatus sp.]|nr:hypothetical protein [Microlunatus sp.]